MADYITLKRLEEKHESTGKKIAEMTERAEDEKSQSVELQSLSRKHILELRELQNKSTELKELIDETRAASSEALNEAPRRVKTG